ncbi:hypothetical protein [Nocardia wallacei]|uniref:Lipoprotein n=1 Tax=Nocardia wallacei TaxID=480035 RepID=A0A7G1KW09_9NOCA|nr:hypothetical protein [Nocardia wallacei]BCK58363.1 hypothetical protein NWFMUON74_61350 [Nocardia wallacei]
MRSRSAALVVLTTGLLITSCTEGPSPDFVSGTVIAKDHTEEMWIPVTISCGQNCTTTIQQYVPGSYTLHVSWYDHGYRNTDIAVESVAYEQIEVGDTYPRTEPAVPR